MTCIVGYVSKGKVYLGGDSAGVAGYSISIRKDPKVFKSGEFIIGFTTSFRMGQVLMSSKFNPPEQTSSQSEYQYMITTFVDTVISLFKDNGYLQKKNEEISGGTFLVGYRGKLYEINDDFQVAENEDNFSSVGCGHDIAKGAMFVLNKLPFSPEAKVKSALNAASRFSAGVAPPFTIVSLNSTTKTHKK